MQKTSAPRHVWLLLALSLALAVVYTPGPWPARWPAPYRIPCIPCPAWSARLWFWLLSDNLLGNSALFSNPYEFAAGAGMVPGNYANFPYSLLYLLFLPLGPVGAYNALLLLSFPLSALAGYLLARSHSADPWAAGACALALGLMEPHLAYFLALTLGLYLPGRLILERPVEMAPGPGDPARPWPELAAVLALAVFAALALGRESGLYPWASALPAWVGAALTGWLTLSALVHRLTVLSFAAARRAVGLCFLAFLPLAAYAVQRRLDVPPLGRILLLLCLGLFLAGLLRVWLRHRDPLPMPAWPRLMAAGLGRGVGLGLAFLLRQRASTLLGSLAGAGRDLREVLLFSPRPESLWTLAGLMAFLAVVLTMGPGA